MEWLNRKLVFIIAGFLALVAVAAGVFWFSGGYQDWQENRAEQALVNKADEVQRRIEEAYRNDTYGGKTPQETLDMFVAALRAGDVELASKYFALDDNLSREKWYEALIKAKEENRFAEMIDFIEKAVPDPNGPLYKNDFGFVIYMDDGSIGTDINMELNPLTKVWKIESL